MPTQKRYQPLVAWVARPFSLCSHVERAAPAAETPNRPQPRGLLIRIQPLRTYAGFPSRMFARLISSAALALALLIATLTAQAEITIVDAWARTTAPGQQVAAAYLRMMSDQPMVLVGANSAFADKVELHDVQVDNGVMKMRQVSEMALEPKRVVELKPGGLHLMLTGIKGAVKVGDNIPLTLIFVDKHNRQENVNIILNGRAPAAYGLPTHGH